MEIEVKIDKHSMQQMSFFPLHTHGAVLLGNKTASVHVRSAVYNHCASLTSSEPDLAKHNYPGRSAITPTVTPHLQGLLELHSIK